MYHPLSLCNTAGALILDGPSLVLSTSSRTIFAWPCGLALRINTLHPPAPCSVLPHSLLLSLSLRVELPSRHSFAKPLVLPNAVASNFEPDAIDAVANASGTCAVASSSAVSVFSRSDEGVWSPSAKFSAAGLIGLFVPAAAQLTR
jgi:hypothetical protein